MLSFTAVRFAEVFFGKGHINETNNCNCISRYSNQILFLFYITAISGLVCLDWTMPSAKSQAYLLSFIIL